MRLGRAALATGDFEAAYGLLERAQAGAASLGDPPLLAETLGWLSRVCWLVGRWQEALDTADAGVEALAGLPETPQLARALARRSQIAMLRGSPESEEHAVEAMAVAHRVGDEHAELNAHINLVTSRANRGIAPDEDEILEIVERALAIGDVDEAYRAFVNFLWSAQAYLSLEQLERAHRKTAAPVAEVPAVENFDFYLERSYANLVDVPAGRWDAVDRVVASRPPPRLQLSMRMVHFEVVGGMALRRGDLAAAAQPLAELRELALASGEPQRILPMAGVVLPFAALTGDTKTVREVGEAVLERTDREWTIIPTAGIPRGLAAATEIELLGRVADAFRQKQEETPSPRLAISADVGAGLFALASGRPADAVEPLRAAVEAERVLGWIYRAACLELELAAALDALGQAAGGSAARARAAAVLEPLGCVNPY